MNNIKIIFKSSFFLLIAICQRDSENYYEFIRLSSDQILTNLVEFFNNHIRNKFPSNDFVVDIYRKDSVSICCFLFT